MLNSPSKYTLGHVIKWSKSWSSRCARLRTRMQHWQITGTKRKGSQHGEQQQQIIVIGNCCSTMISQENQRFIISAVVGLIVLLGLITYTNLPTLVRLPAALIVWFIVFRILESFGE